MTTAGYKEMENSEAGQEAAQEAAKAVQHMSGHDIVFSLLMEGDEVTWQSLLFELVAQERMDPWDIDISMLAVKFLELLKKLKETDFRISGKVILASALLLRMKSQKLVDEDLAALDRMIESPEEFLDYVDSAAEGLIPISKDHPPLFVKTPQPRKRKVSLYDLMEALEKALEVQSRRKRFVLDPKDVKARIPEKKIDIGKVMESLFARIEKHYKESGTKEQKLLFHNLAPSDSRQDKILTFIPLLHLDTARKVDLAQEKHFGDIEVQLAKLDPYYVAGIHEKDIPLQGSASVKAETAKTAKNS